MSFDGFDALLSRRTRLSSDGIVRVDYAGWASSAPDRAALKAVIKDFEGTSPASLSRADQFAFWANLYNAATLDVVLEAFPVKSIRDIRPGLLDMGPWKKKVVTVAGRALSLDDIEHGILRKDWKDPRVHYAVNCASISCPNLPRRAWRGSGLDTALDVAAKAYVNHPRGAMFKGSSLTISSIYQWYKADFGGNDAGVIAHLKKYADGPLKAQLATTTKVSDTRYDWSLNRV